MRRPDVTVVVHLRLLPDFIEKGKKNLLKFAETVRRQEPECALIEVAQDIDDPTRITMIERWSNREAYEGPHLQTEHMKAFVDESSQYFDGPASISFYEATVVGRPEPVPNDSKPESVAPYGR